MPAPFASFYCRQAVIKTLLRQGLDQHFASTASRQMDRNRMARGD
jgi:hypothetical protein